MIRAVLCDIEGTTTSLSFAQDVLFPVSYRKMQEFIHKNWDQPELATDLNSLRKQTGKSDLSAEEAVTLLRNWIQEDKKETVLKSIQGKIWKESFESGAIRGHVYPDVPECFQKWKAQGLRIAIFSSGSVQAQQLIFRYSEAGDLTRWIDVYFDTTTGSKKEASSYIQIAEKLNLQTAEIVFLSDVEEELDAAEQAGMETVLLIRDSRAPSTRAAHRSAHTFFEVLPEP